MTVFRYFRIYTVYKVSVYKVVYDNAGAYVITICHILKYIYSISKLYIFYKHNRQIINMEDHDNDESLATEDEIRDAVSFLSSEFVMSERKIYFAGEQIY